MKRNRVFKHVAKVAKERRQLKRREKTASAGKTRANILEARLAANVTAQAFKIIGQHANEVDHVPLKTSVNETARLSSRRAYRYRCRSHNWTITRGNAPSYRRRFQIPAADSTVNKAMLVRSVLSFFLLPPPPRRY